MPLKDYYSILEIESSASIPEIKKAYRRLALQYHPDKKPGDPYAVAQFAEIKEAYEVLTNPAKKEYYLQQRWYEQSIGTKRNRLPVTPVNILKQVIELERYVSKLDVFRMDKQGLHDHIMTLLDDDSIEKLNAFDEKDTNDQVIPILINCLKVLPLDLLLPLQQQIEKIRVNEMMQEKFSLFLAQRKKANKRDRYKIWIIMLAVIVLCLMIIFFA